MCVSSIITAERLPANISFKQMGCLKTDYYCSDEGVVFTGNFKNIYICNKIKFGFEIQKSLSV